MTLEVLTIDFLFAIRTFRNNVHCVNRVQPRLTAYFSPPSFSRPEARKGRHR